MREVLLTEGDVAKILRKSKATVSRLRKAGKIIPVKVGSSWLFTAERVEEFIRANEVGTPIRRGRAKPYVCQEI